MENSNILTPNIDTGEENEEQIGPNDNNGKNEKINNIEQIEIPDWDLVPPFETIDRSVL